MTKRQGPWEGKEERRRAVSPVLCFPPSSVRTFSSRERDLWVRLSEQLTRRDFTSYCKYHVKGNARRLLMSVHDFNSQRSHNWQTILLNDQWSSFLWEDEHISLSLRTVSFLCSLWGSKGDEGGESTRLQPISLRSSPWAGATICRLSYYLVVGCFPCCEGFLNMAGRTFWEKAPLWG